MQIDDRTSQATPTIRALEAEEKPAKVLRDSGQCGLSKNKTKQKHNTEQSNEETVPIKGSKKR